MIERELRRIPVLGDDGAWLVACELRFEAIEATTKGSRVRIGARRWILSSGQALRPLSEGNFLVLDSGEIVTRR